MEIPVLESGISRFQNPNLLLQLRCIWTWIALVVVAVATFSSLIRRLRRVVRFRKGRSVIFHPSSCSSSPDNESCSSSDHEEHDQEDDDEISAASENDSSDFNEILGQDDNFDGYLNWPTELPRDGSVVKFWDVHERSRRDEIPAVHVASPGMILLARDGGLKVWDPRTVESECATYQGNGLGRVVRILGGGKDSCMNVYVGDDVGKIMAVDLRNVKSPFADGAILGPTAKGGLRGAGRIWPSA